MFGVYEVGEDEMRLGILYNSLVLRNDRLNGWDYIECNLLPSGI